MNKKQNSKDGGVFSIPRFRSFEIGIADFTPVAAVCSTDGVFDYFVPQILKDEECKVYVPLVNLFVTYGLNVDENNIITETEKCKKRMIDYLSSDVCKMMTDDLSVAVLIVTDSFLDPEEIEWEEPEIDYYSIMWDKVSIYSSEQTKINCFINKIKDKNPDWTEKQIEEFTVKYIEDMSKKNNYEEQSVFQNEISISDSETKVNENINESSIEHDDNEVKSIRGFRGLFIRKKN